MKKLILTLVILPMLTCMSFAQKYAFVDVEYILRNIPAYESAQEQLETFSKKWEAEVQLVFNEAQETYKKYAEEKIYLSVEEKKKREQLILSKEKEARDLKAKYFGPEGQLFNRQQSLIAPIQEEVYNAIKEIAEDEEYALILDKSSSTNIIYSNTKYDLSDLVLQKLGYN